MFMSSGHWTNTGMAKFINDNLYNYKSDDEKSMNPFRWYRLQNGDDVSKYRETINGFPCRLILINDGSTPLNEGQNEPTPGNTKDMGIFNFNHDKDATTTLGFNSDIFPNCASYEVTANSDTSAGAFISYMNSKNIFKHENAFNGFIIEGENHPCEIQIYNGAKVYHTSGSTPDNSTFKIRNCFKENTVYTLQFNYTVPDSVGWAMVYVRYTDGTAQSLNYKGVVKPTITSNTGKTIEQIDFLNPETCYIYSDSILLLEGDILEEGGADELAYLKESFELRHPDADDVSEDWGFMGVEDTVLKIDEYLYYGSIKTSNMEANYFNSDNITITFDNNASFSFVPTGTNVSPQYGVRSGTTISLEGVDRFHLAAPGWTYVDINGVRYYKGVTHDINFNTRNENPYESTIFDTAYSLKALIDWVDGCTDEEFVADFEEHFHKDYTLRYFCLVTLVGAVDNLG